MTLLIKNGTIVTATDLYKGDVLVDGEKITTIGTALTMPADRVIDATGKYLFPGGIDVHTHLDMPFGGSTSADDFETGHDRRGARRHDDRRRLRDSVPGQTLHHAWETWMKKAEGKAAIDYGFHMIITELNDQVEHEMDALVRQGVTSFKLFMAYPGVFMLDDASIFKALLRTGKNGGTICMHAENGGVIDVLVKKALAEGQDRAEVSRADAARARRGRGDASRHRARRNRRRADLHRPPVGGRGARDGHRGARPRPAGVRGDLPAVSVPVVRQLRGAGLRGREVRDEPAAPAEGHAGPAVARPRVQRPAGHLDRPLPVLHEGAEGARRGRLLEDPERRARHRDAHEPRLRRRRARRAASRSTASSSSRPRRPRRSSASFRARAPSPPARTPTSSSSIPEKKMRSA